MADGLCRLSEGKNGGSIFHSGDGFYYLVKERLISTLRLKCRLYNSGCRATASLDLRTNVLHHLQHHSHGPDHLLLEDMELRRRIMRDARQEVFGRRPRAIMRDWRLRCGNVQLAMRFTNSRMCSALYRVCAASYPKIPNSLLHLGILIGLPNMAAVCRTVDGGDLLFKGIAGNAADKTLSLVFVSGRMLQLLQRAPSIHADGTFKKRCRKPKCSQIYNFVCKYGDTVIALARAIMMRRTQASYLALLNYLKVLAPDLDPHVIHCDFERAQVNGWRVVFPNAMICGCLWHYAVACSRYARRNGMAELVSENEMVHSFLRCICAAPMLPQHLIQQGVLEIWAEIEAAGWGPVFQSLLQYFEREWIPRLGELSVYGQADRTNNCSECDNRMIANVLPQNRPNVWRLLGGLVQLEYLSWSSKLAADAGRAVNGPRRWSAIANDRRVQRHELLLEQGYVTPGQFLHRVSWSIHAAVDHGLALRDSDDSDSEDEG